MFSFIFRDKGKKYFVYRIAYEIVNFNVVHIEVEHVYFESESGELPVHLENYPDVVKVALANRFNAVVSVKMTTIKEVDYKEYRKYKKGRMTKFRPSDFM